MYLKASKKQSSRWRWVYEGNTFVERDGSISSSKSCNTSLRFIFKLKVKGVVMFKVY